MGSPRRMNIPTGLPDVPSGVDGELYDFLARIKEIVEVGGGRATAREQYVRGRDLESLGIDLAYVDPAKPPYDFGGGGVGSGEDVPGPPTNLNVDNQVFANVLTWDNPTTDVEDVSHIEIWAAKNTSDRSFAVLVGAWNWDIDETEGVFTHSALDIHTDYYYWIRTKTYGSLYSTWEPDGQGGLVSPATFETVNELWGKLLADSAYFDDEYTIIASSFKVIQPSSTIDAYVAADEYNKGDLCSYGGLYYQSIEDFNTGNTPDTPLSAWWEEIPAASLDVADPVFMVGQIEGSPAVGIRGQLIVDGTIVADSLVAETLTAREMSAHDIFTWSVRSGNYSAGVSGFLIDSDPGSATYGQAEFNGIKFVINDWASDVGGTGIPSAGADVTADEIGSVPAGDFPTTVQNAYTTKSDVGLSLVDNYSAATLMGMNHTGFVQGKTIITGNYLSANLVLADGIVANSTFTNNLYVGSRLTVNASGAINSTGKTSYADTTAGFWMGYDDSGYKFNIGNSTRYLKWSGTDVLVGGDIIATGNVKANNIGDNESVYSLKTHTGSGYEALTVTATVTVNRPCGIIVVGSLIPNSQTVVYGRLRVYVDSVLVGGNDTGTNNVDALSATGTLAVSSGSHTVKMEHYYYNTATQTVKMYLGGIAVLPTG